MTSNQIAYWQLQREKQYNAATVGENRRHNMSTESISRGELFERQRHQRVEESLGYGNLAVNQMNARTNVGQLRVAERNAASNERNAATNAYNAELNRYNAELNAMNAATNRMNYQANMTNAMAKQTTAQAKMLEASTKAQEFKTKQPGLLAENDLKQQQAAWYGIQSGFKIGTDVATAVGKVAPALAALA